MIQIIIKEFACYTCSCIIVIIMYTRRVQPFNCYTFLCPLIVGDVDIVVSDGRENKRKAIVQKVEECKYIAGAPSPLQ